MTTTSFLELKKKFYFSCSEYGEEIEVDSYEQGQTLAKIHTFSDGHEEDIAVYYITTKEILFR